MAHIYADIGEVVQTDTLTVEWKIPDFSSLSKVNGVYYKSPRFILSNTEWYLTLKHISGTTYLALECCSNLKFKNILFCNLGIKGADVLKKAVYLKNWHLFQIESLVQHVFDGSAEDCPMTDLLSHDTLTAICCLEIEKRNPSNGYTTLIKNMKELLTNGNDDYDVRIFVGGKEFRAHSNILKARSPVFKMMLTHDTKEKISGDITIEDCDPDTFDEFLLFVYTGEIENLTPSKALHLYYTADKYDFAELKEECLCCMKRSLSTSSVCDIGLLARIHGEEELLEKAIEYFRHNINKIIFTVEWQNFLSKHPIEANELFIKSCVV